MSTQVGSHRTGTRRRRVTSADAPAPPPEDAVSPVRSALSVLATVGPPITIVTALLYYFGWARASAQARSMGLDVSLFGYSTQDYLLRSISSLYIPLLGAAILGLGWLAVHERITAALDRPRPPPLLRTAGRDALLAGLVLGAGAVGVAFWDPRGLVVLSVSLERVVFFVPLLLAGSAALAAYGSWLVRASGRHGHGSRPDERYVASPPWQRALRAVLVGGVITLALFWQVAGYAGVVGRGYAQDVAQRVPELPRATALSPAPLGIQAPGVEQELITVEAAPEEAARYRTTGLRLLVRSGGRMFLLHDGWTPGGGTVIVLPDDGAVRWQFSR